MRHWLWVLWFSIVGGVALAQTRLDPGFASQRIYQPAAPTAALQLTNGMRLLFGVSYAEQQAVPGLAAYTAAGQLDGAFQANLAAASWTAIKGATEAAGGKIWVVAEQATYGSTTYKQLLRLNADGSRDVSFAPQTANWGTVQAMVVQPDGKVVVAGNFNLPGSSGAVPLLRFEADGQPDVAFNNRMNVVPGPGSHVVLQPDGKLLVVVAGELWRLESNGTRDPGFRLPLAVDLYCTVGIVALQPDGRILLSSYDINTPLFVGSSRRFVRLLATGALDTSFNPSTGWCPQRNDFIVPTVQVQPDGKIIVAANRLQFPQSPDAQRYLARLLPTGAFDPAWQFPAPTNPDTYFEGGATSVQLLPTGEMLAAGNLLLTGAATGLPTGIRLLQASGAVLPTFRPLLQQGGEVDGLQLQPDGRIIVGGYFSAFNGLTARSLGRLLPDGQPDQGFLARSPFNEQQAALGLLFPLLAYPDGRVLIGGRFTLHHNGTRYTNLVRLLANGRLDSTFSSTVFTAGSPFGDGSMPGYGEVSSASLLPSGDLVIRGVPAPNGSYAGSSFLVRLTADGQLDSTFQPAVADPTAVLLLPNGQLLVGARATATAGASIRRLLPDGAADVSFSAVSITNGNAIGTVRQLAHIPTGGYMVHGVFTAVGGVSTSFLARLTPAGLADPGFVMAPGTLQSGFGSIGSPLYGMAVQPNGRVLVGGLIETPGNPNQQTLLRVLPDGTLDATFGLPIPPNGLVLSPTIQPDGAILCNGWFTQADGQVHLGLTRLLDPHVLAVGRRQDAAATVAYPNPAHERLYLRLDAAAGPRRVQLLDALGRPVLTQPVALPELTLSTATLPTGTYLLRVEYASGTVTRRVVLE